MNNTNDGDTPFNTCKECGGRVASELDDTGRCQRVVFLKYPPFDSREW